jgi:hypothetical protein
MIHQTSLIPKPATGHEPEIVPQNKLLNQELNPEPSKYEAEVIILAGLATAGVGTKLSSKDSGFGKILTETETRNKTTKRKCTSKRAFCKSNKTKHSKLKYQT